MNGNNIGHAGDPNWAIFDLSAMPGPILDDKKQLSILNSGDPSGNAWCPAECFVPTRSTWTWQKGDDDKIVAADKLTSAWFKSRGRNCVLLMNVPIDEEGKIPDGDAKLLKTCADNFNKSLSTDLLLNHSATASNSRGETFAANCAVDGKPETYWATDDGVNENCSLEVDLGKPTQFDTSAVRENIALGQRVSSYRIDYFTGGQWQTGVKGTSIGRLKIERLAKPVTADKVRLIIEKSRACPTIASFSLYLR